MGHNHPTMGQQPAAAVAGPLEAHRQIVACFLSEALQQVLMADQREAVK